MRVSRYLAALRDAVPFLRDLGWRNLNVVSGVARGSHVTAGAFEDGTIINGGAGTAAGGVGSQAGSLGDHFDCSVTTLSPVSPPANSVCDIAGFSVLVGFSVLPELRVW